MFSRMDLSDQTSACGTAVLEVFVVLPPRVVLPSDSRRDSFVAPQLLAYAFTPRQNSNTTASNISASGVLVLIFASCVSSRTW